MSTSPFRSPSPSPPLPEVASARSRSSSNIRNARRNSTPSPIDKLFNNNGNKLPKSPPSNYKKPTIIIPSSNKVPTLQSSMREDEEILECDYDVNPTKLYLSIQHKKWELANNLIKAQPQQAKTWIYRKESDKKKQCPVEEKGDTECVELVVTPKVQEATSLKIRWRLLPLHAAVIFKAPESIIQALITAYPRACCFKDDQGMLPIHLAIRNESLPSIITMLLIAFPQSANIGDRKNRTPLHLTQLMKCILLQEKYINVLQNYNYYYEVAAASFNASTLYQADPNKKNLNVQFDAQKLALIGKVDSLELELAKSKDENKLLVDHLDTVQSQLKAKADSNVSMTQNITELENELKGIKEEKETMEAQYKRQLESKVKEIEVLQSDLNAREGDIDLYKQINNEKDKSIAIGKERSAASRFDREQLEERTKLFEVENASSLANAAHLELQLKKKIQNEHVLAIQVSDLASKLSESALMCSELTNTHQTQIKSYQQEKAEMKTSYDNLVSKLQYLLRTLDDMTKEHNRIIELSCNQEQTISEMFEQQEELASQTARHEQCLIDAAWEREEIVRILTRQVEESEKSKNERLILMDSVKDNNRRIADTAGERRELINSITKSRGLLGSFKKEVNDLYEAVNNEVDGISLDSDKVKSSNENCDFRSIEEKCMSDQCNSEENDFNAQSAEATTVNASSESVTESVDMDSSMSTLSSTLNDENIKDDDVGRDEKIDEDAFRKECEEDEDKEENALAEISMNVKNSVTTKIHLLDDVESSVDNLCKEAAALIASLPSPKKTNMTVE